MNQRRWTDGWTALHLAAMLGAEATARRLLEAGASASLGDPAATAASFGFPAVAALCRAAPARRVRRERQIRRPEPGEAAAGDTGEEGGSLLGNITEVIERRRLERLEAKRRRLQEGEAGGAEDQCSAGAEAGQDRRGRRRSQSRGQEESLWTDESEASAKVEAVEVAAVNACVEGSVEAKEAAPPRSRLATLTSILVAGAVSGVVLRYLVIE